ncbi:HTH-like domain protein [Pseudomonas aeruginosa]|nr:HTH-like domain protein [Pseudomonas aeruginosa]
MQARTGISERRACQLIGLSRSVLRYQPRASVQNTELQAQLVELAQERRRFGYRRLHILLRRAGVQVNHKRIYRLYRAAGLMVKRRHRRHGVAVERERLSLPSASNQVWSMDFAFDALSTGRRIKCLTVVDDFTKESVGILVDARYQRLSRHTGAGRDGTVSRLPESDPHRPGARVHRQGTRSMGLSARHQAEADSTW